MSSARRISFASLLIVLCGAQYAAPPGPVTDVRLLRAGLSSPDVVAVTSGADGVLQSNPACDDAARTM